MFSTDILFSLNEKSLFFFPKNINKELDVFNRFFIPLKVYFSSPIILIKELDVFNTYSIFLPK